MFPIKPPRFEVKKEVLEACPVPIIKQEPKESTPKRKRAKESNRENEDMNIKRAKRCQTLTSPQTTRNVAKSARAASKKSEGLIPKNPLNDFETVETSTHEEFDESMKGSTHVDKFLDDFAKTLNIPETSDLEEADRVLNSCEKRPDQTSEIKSLAEQTKESVGTQIRFVRIGESMHFVAAPISKNVTDTDTEEIVSSLSYTQIRKQVRFNCHFENCCFKHTSEQLFGYHLTTRHLLVSWNGLCKICNGKVSEPGSRIDEFSHMYNEHILNSIEIMSSETLEDDESRLHDELLAKEKTSASGTHRKVPVDNPSSRNKTALKISKISSISHF